MSFREQLRLRGAFAFFKVAASSVCAGGRVVAIFGEKGTSIGVSDERDIAFWSIFDRGRGMMSFRELSPISSHM